MGKRQMGAFTPRDTISSEPGIQNQKAVQPATASTDPRPGPKETHPRKLNTPSLIDEDSRDQPPAKKLKHNPNTAAVSKRGPTSDVVPNGSPSMVASHHDHDAPVAANPVWVGVSDWTDLRPHDQEIQKRHRRQRSQGSSGTRVSGEMSLPDTAHKRQPRVSPGEKDEDSSARNIQSIEEVLEVEAVEDEGVKQVARPQQPQRTKIPTQSKERNASFQVPDDPISDSDCEPGGNAERCLPNQTAHTTNSLEIVKSSSRKQPFLDPETNEQKSLSKTFRRNEPDDEKDELAIPSSPFSPPRASNSDTKGHSNHEKLQERRSASRSRSRSRERKEEADIPSTNFKHSSHNEEQFSGKKPVRKSLSSSTDRIGLELYQRMGGTRVERKGATVDVDKTQKLVRVVSASYVKPIIQLKNVTSYYYASDGSLFYALERSREGYAQAWHFMVFATSADLTKFVERLRLADPTMSGRSKPNSYIEKVFERNRGATGHSKPPEEPRRKHPGPKPASTDREMELMTKNLERQATQTTQPSRKSKVTDQMRIATTAKQTKGAPSDSNDYDETKPKSISTKERPERNLASGGLAKRTGGSTRRNQQDAKPIEKKPQAKYSKKHGLGNPWAKPLEFPRHGVNKATVEFGDLFKLDDEEYLNDTLISFCLRYAQLRSSSLSNRVHVFNSFFYDTLTKPVKGKRGINYDGVRRWTAKIKLLEDYDYIVVPINESLHWYVAIICNLRNVSRASNVEPLEGAADLIHSERPGEESASATLHGARSLPDESDPGTIPNGQGVLPDPPADSRDEQNRLRSARTLDSQSPAANYTPTSPISREDNFERKDQVQTARKTEKLETEDNISGERKRKSTSRLRNPDEPLIITLDSFEHEHPQVIKVLKDYLKAEAQDKLNTEIEPPGGHRGRHVPKQDNFSDCGLYLIAYIAKFLENPPEFIRKLVTHQFNQAQDWPSLDPEFMRHNIRDIIMREHQKFEAGSTAGCGDNVATENEHQTAFQEFNIPRPELRRSSTVSARAEDEECHPRSSVMAQDESRRSSNASSHSQAKEDSSKPIASRTGSRQSSHAPSNSREEKRSPTAGTSPPKPWKPSPEPPSQTPDARPGVEGRKRRKLDQKASKLGLIISETPQMPETGNAGAEHDEPEVTMSGKRSAVEGTLEAFLPGVEVEAAAAEGDPGPLQSSPINTPPPDASQDTSTQLLHQFERQRIDEGPPAGPDDGKAVGVPDGLGNETSKYFRGDENPFETLTTTYGVPSLSAAEKETQRRMAIKMGKDAGAKAWAKARRKSKAAAESQRTEATNSEPEVEAVDTSSDAENESSPPRPVTRGKQLR